MKISCLWKIPEELGVHGQRLWKNVGPLLVEAGVLDELDRETFLTLCQVYHKMCVCDAILETEGLSTDGTRGTVKKSPLFSQWRAYSDLYLKLLSHFGLSPYSRGVKVVPRAEVEKNGKGRFFK